jgi:hypothetical protein
MHNLNIYTWTDFQRTNLNEIVSVIQALESLNVY